MILKQQRKVPNHLLELRADAVGVVGGFSEPGHGEAVVVGGSGDGGEAGGVDGKVHGLAQLQRRGESEEGDVILEVEAGEAGMLMNLEWKEVLELPLRFFTESAGFPILQ